LSPVFDPHGLQACLPAGSVDRKLYWFDLESLCKQHALPGYVRATRTWAHGEAFGDREVLACAYIYLVRQLQFPGAKVDLIRAFISEIVARGLAI